MTSAVAEMVALREQLQIVPEQVVDSIRDRIQDLTDPAERMSATLLMLELMTVPADLPAEQLSEAEAQALAAAELKQFRTSEDAAEEAGLFVDLFIAIEAGDSVDAVRARELLTERGYLSEAGRDQAIVLVKAVEQR